MKLSAPTTGGETREAEKPSAPGAGIALSAAMALYSLGEEDESAVDALLACLSSDIETCNFLTAAFRLAEARLMPSIKGWMDGPTTAFRPPLRAMITGATAMQVMRAPDPP